MLTVSQSGSVEPASRAALTAQSTGLTRAMTCIQPGMRLRAMMADDMNVNGRMAKFTAAIRASSLRTIRASACEKAATVTATSDVALSRTAGPTSPLR